MKSEEIFVCACFFILFNSKIVKIFILQEIQEQPVKFLSACYPLQPESIKRLCPEARPEDGH